MAAIKPNKFPLYQSLYNLNQAFETVAQEIERLRQLKTAPAHTLNLHLSHAEELRAGLNHTIVDKLNAREEEDWAIYGKRRIEQERKLAES